MVDAGTALLSVLTRAGPPRCAMLQGQQVQARHHHLLPEGCVCGVWEEGAGVLHHQGEGVVGVRVRGWVRRE